MDIFPAIDIIDGKVVRLLQGDYDKETIYSENPREIAEKFRAAGASHLHVVDLDGAKGIGMQAGTRNNFETIRSIVDDLGMFVEVGGGIRDEARIKEYLDAGVARVILGTVAQKDPAFLKEMVEKYGGAIAVGVDASDGKVAINGWKEITDKDSYELCEEMYELGVETIIYTDISKDGAEQGTNIEAYTELMNRGRKQGLDFASSTSELTEGIRSVVFAKKSRSITASGGISSYEELEALRDMGITAAILGKAMYTDRLDLARCIEVSEQE